LSSADITPDLVVVTTGIEIESTTIPLVLTKENAKFPFASLPPSRLTSRATYASASCDNLVLISFKASLLIVPEP